MLGIIVAVVRKSIPTKAAKLASLDSHMELLQAVIRGILASMLAVLDCIDYFNHCVLGRVAGAFAIRRPRDFSCPPPAERLAFDAAAPLSGQLQGFRSNLHSTEYQHGTQHGDGDPMLYLYMERALRAYPSLAAHVTRNEATALIPDEELFAIPARDARVMPAMYNRSGCNRGSFPGLPLPSSQAASLRLALARCLDLRDWAAALAAAAKSIVRVATVSLQSLCGTGAGCGGSGGELTPAGPLGGAEASGGGVPSAPAPASVGLASWVHTEAFDTNPIFSFSGAAWLIIYHVGAASALQERWSLSAPSARLCGTSSGSVVAACTGSGLQMSDMIVRCFEKWLACNERVMGPVGVMGSLVHEAMTRHVERAGGHKLCSDRVKIAITPLQDMASAHAGDKTVFPVEDAGALFHAGLEAGWLQAAHVSHFDTAAALTEAVLGSCYIPLYSDMPGRITRGVAHGMQPEEWAARRSEQALIPQGADADTPLVCWDGGLSSNYPRWFGQGELREMRALAAGGRSTLDRFTVTVSPTAGEAAISPGQAQGQQGKESAVKSEACYTGLAGKGEKGGGAVHEGGFVGRGFVVDGALCSEGWGPDETLFPMTPERWWHVFFAGRAHAQAWMAQQGFGPAASPANV